MKRFKGKVAVVTGGGSGIGRAITEGLVADGANVLITGRREAPLQELSAKHDGAVALLAGDVGKSGTARQIVDEVVRRFGRLDFVVNNAAAADILPLSETTDEMIDQMLAVNVKGPLALSRDAVGELAKTKGAIINISSVAAQAAVPGFAVYAGTKSAGDRATKVLANELGPMGIRVNTVSPGLTKTPMFDRTMGPQPEAIETMVGQTALRRVGEPGEVARAALWLLSDDGAWVTGQVLQSSGGLMIS